jgi:hypothetical protein
MLPDIEGDQPVDATVNPTEVEYGPNPVILTHLREEECVNGARADAIRKQESRFFTNKVAPYLTALEKRFRPVTRSLELQHAALHQDLFVDLCSEESSNFASPTPTLSSCADTGSGSSETTVVQTPLNYAPIVTPESLDSSTPSSCHVMNKHNQLFFLPASGPLGIENYPITEYPSTVDDRLDSQSSIDSVVVLASPTTPQPKISLASVDRHLTGHFTSEQSVVQLAHNLIPSLVAKSKAKRMDLSCKDCYERFKSPGQLK